MIMMAIRHGPWAMPIVTQSGRPKRSSQVSGLYVGLNQFIPCLHVVCRESRSASHRVTWQCMIVCMFRESSVTLGLPAAWGGTDAADELLPTTWVSQRGVPVL